MIWVVILCRIFVNQHWKQYWLKWHSTLMLSYVMLCYVMLCYVMLCCVVLCRVVSCRVVSCRVVSCRVADRGGMAWHGMIWYGMAWHGMLWYAMVCYGMLWYRESEHVLRDFFGRLFYQDCLSETRPLITNHVHSFQWNVITHPCPNFNGGLVKPPLMLRYG